MFQDCILLDVFQLFSNGFFNHLAARIAAIRQQLKRIPPEASHVVVSVGGNNATGASTTVLGADVANCEEAMIGNKMKLMNSFDILNQFLNHFESS